MPQKIVPTVRVLHPDGFAMLINAADYDPARHTLADAVVAEPEAESDASAEAPRARRRRSES